jgi:hypothetical protein
VKPGEQAFYEHERFFALIDKIKAKPWHWLSLSALMVGCDYATGAVIQFPLLHILPVSLAAWSGRKSHAYVLSVLLPTTRLLLKYAWHIQQTPFDMVVNFSIRVVVLAGLVYLLLSLQSMRLLKGMLHICSNCKRIETTEGTWLTTEEVIVHHSEAMLSHGICPECAAKHWGRLPKKSKPY